MNTGRTGWLSPDAEFIECESWEHDSKAEELAKALNIYDESASSDEVLIENGWIRISWLTALDFGLSFGGKWGKHVTERQREHLRNIYDNDRDLISKNGLHELYSYGVIEYDELESE